MLKKIGDRRSFTFDKKEQYQIVDIIKEPNFQLDWKWQDIICPHCNKAISKVTTHSFRYIEILVPMSKINSNKNEQINHIRLLGYSKDNKYLLISKGYNTVLIKKSEFFRELFNV